MEVNETIGYCICVHCNIRLPHLKGQPCREIECPDCGKKMMREGSYHHQLYLKKIGESKNETSSSNKR